MESTHAINAPPRPSQVNIISSFFSLNENSSSTLGSQTMIFYLKFMSFIDPVLHHLDYPIQYYMNSKILNPQFHAYHMEVILCFVEKLIFQVDVSRIYTRLLSLSVLTVCLKCKPSIPCLSHGGHLVLCRKINIPS